MPSEHVREKLHRQRARTACAALLVLTSCGPESPCPEVSCTSRVAWTVPLSMPFTQVQALTVEFCVNDVCVQGPLAALLEPPGVNASSMLTVPREVRSTEPKVQLTAKCRAHGFDLQAEFGMPAADGHDGDRARARLLDAAGEAVAAIDQVVTYSRFHAAAPECRVTCDYAVIGERT